MDLDFNNYNIFLESTNFNKFNNYIKSKEEFFNGNNNYKNKCIMYSNPFQEIFLKNNIQNLNNDFLNNKILSVPTAFNLILGLLISSIICFIMAIYESHECLINSILRRNSGNKLIGFCFWKIIDYIRQSQRERERNELSFQINNFSNHTMNEININENPINLENEIINLNEEENFQNGMSIFKERDCNFNQKNLHNNEFENMLRFKNNIAFINQYENDDVYKSISNYKIELFDKNNLNPLSSYSNLRKNLINKNCKIQYLSKTLENANLCNSNSTIHLMSYANSKDLSLAFDEKEDILTRRYYSNNKIIGRLSNNFNMIINKSYYHNNNSFSNSERNFKENSYSDKFYNIFSDTDEIIKRRHSSSKSFDNLRNVL